jgi:transketolase
MKTEELIETSRQLRIKIIEMLYRIGMEYKGHPGPALSMADIITCLYFDVLNIDPADPKWKERDRFVLSKGHACPALYAALCLRGFFKEEHLYTLRHIDSMLQGHPDMRKTPGIDMTAGSLGHGLGAGLGIALAGRLDKMKYKVYVMLGDGELQEGLIWESAMSAGHFKMDTLVAIIDRNKWQSCDLVECTIDVEPLKEKFKAFNWDIMEIDGHDVAAIVQALKKPLNKKPLAIIANTIKGKGVSFMEGNNSWHQRGITNEEYNIAIKDLKGSE